MIVRERASTGVVGCLDVWPLVDLLNNYCKFHSFSDEEWENGHRPSMWYVPNNAGQRSLAKIISESDPNGTSSLSWLRLISGILHRDEDGNPAPESTSSGAPRTGVRIETVERICNALGVTPHYVWPDYCAVSEEWAEHSLAKNPDGQLSLLEAS